MRVRVKSLGVARAAELETFEWDEDLPAGGFCVETLYSGFSAGTELSYFKGTNPYLRRSWDPELCAFVDEGPGRSYPIESLGYMEVGRVTHSESHLSVGDVVAMAYGHKDVHVARASDFHVQLPADVDPLLGIYVAQMGPIAANGVLHAVSELTGAATRSLGDGMNDKRVLVLGAGVVGLLVAAFARLHGATVVVADRSPLRLAAARGLGAEAVDETTVEVWRHCKDRWRHRVGDRGADFVFQCRGRPSYLAKALRSLRPQGTVVDLAFYQEGAPELNLGEEFHHNGLTIRCAQIGRVPRGLSDTWGRERLAHETLSLLRHEGDRLREHMITDVVPVHEAPRVVADLASRRRDAIQIVFDYGRC